jgi:hypothetical protein
LVYLSLPKPQKVTKGSYPEWPARGSRNL